MRIPYHVGQNVYYSERLYGADGVAMGIITEIKIDKEGVVRYYVESNASAHTRGTWLTCEYITPTRRKFKRLWKQRAIDSIDYFTERLRFTSTNQKDNGN